MPTFTASEKAVALSKAQREVDLVAEAEDIAELHRQKSWARAYASALVHVGALTSDEQGRLEGQILSTSEMRLDELDAR